MKGREGGEGILLEYTCIFIFLFLRWKDFNCNVIYLNLLSLIQYHDVVGLPGHELISTANSPGLIDRVSLKMAVECFLLLDGWRL